MKPFHIKILKIVSLDEFWVAMKSPGDFLKVIHENIEKDIDRYSDYSSASSSSLLPNEVNKQNLFKQKVFAIYDEKKRRWFRASLVKENRTIQSDRYFMCFLIDTGDTLTVQAKNVRILTNQRLVELTPLAIKCCLAGLVPTEPSTNVPVEKWSPASVQLFYDVSRSNLSLKIQYTDTLNSDENNNNQIARKVNLILMKVDSETNTKKYYSFNDLLVKKKFAIKAEEGRAVNNQEKHQRYHHQSFREVDNNNNNSESTESSNEESFYDFEGVKVLLNRDTGQYGGGGANGKTRDDELRQMIMHNDDYDDDYKQRDCSPQQQQQPQQNWNVVEEGDSDEDDYDDHQKELLEQLRRVETSVRSQEDAELVKGTPYEKFLLKQQKQQQQQQQQQQNEEIKSKEQKRQEKKGDGVLKKYTKELVENRSGGGGGGCPSSATNNTNNNQAIYLNKSFLIVGSPIKPYLNLTDAGFHKNIVDYLMLNVRNSNNLQLNDLHSISWPIINRGRHCAVIAREYKSSESDITTIPFTYLAPILSKMFRTLDASVAHLEPIPAPAPPPEPSLDDENDAEAIMKDALQEQSAAAVAAAAEEEEADEQQQSQKFKNGPILLIICSSCANAQIIYNLVQRMIDVISRTPYYRMNRYKKPFKSLLLQGGGNEADFTIPLLNGCDILIAATPFVLARMIADSRTNFERMKYLVFDEASLMLDKYARQVKAIMHNYGNFIRINENRPVAQMILMSGEWSVRMRTFMEAYLSEPVIAFTNKLEASFFGHTHHVLEICPNESQKLKMLPALLIEHIMTPSVNKNCIVFTSDHRNAELVAESLLKVNLKHVLLAHEKMKALELQSVESKWRKFAQKAATAGVDLKQNQVLVCSQQVANRLESIDDVQNIIHFDFPRSKTIFEERLWLMRKHFSTEKKIIKFSIQKSVDETNVTENGEKRQQLHQQYEYVESDEERLCSFLYVSNEDREHLPALLNYIQRISDAKNTISPDLYSMVEQYRLRKEKNKRHIPLCPFMKAFGKCMNPKPIACQFRHIPDPELDSMKLLNKTLSIPSQGFIKFKVSHVEDTNHFFINLLAYENNADDDDIDLVNSDKLEIEYDSYHNFEIDFQMYFSDPANVVPASEFKIGGLYAIKDIATSLYKRVAVLDSIRGDSRVIYEILIKCIDYGSKYQISSQDLLVLPDRFIELPPQAIEVYLCDIVPIDGDLNWSISSKLFMANKLTQAKDFYGKIQLSAQDTLWLHPISSFKRLKSIDLTIISDSVRLELIQSNYGVNYPGHLKELKQMFEKYGLPVPIDNANKSNVKACYEKVLENLYANLSSNLDEIISYAHLKQLTDETNKVYVCCVDTPGEFFVQNVYSYDLHERLDKDIDAFVNKIESRMSGGGDCGVGSGNKIIGNGKYEEEEMSLIKEEKMEEDRLKDYLLRTKTIRSNLSKSVFDMFLAAHKPFYCLARNIRENKYFRAQLVDFQLTKEGQEQLVVFFVDYGDFSTIDKSDIYPILEKFIRILPFQAIRCQLDGIRPFGLNDKWSPRSSDAFWSMTVDQDRTYKDCYAFVVKELTNSEANKSENNQEICLKSILTENSAVNGAGVGNILKNKSIAYRNLKKYSVKLCLKDYPLKMNAAYKLVNLKHARFIPSQEQILFIKKNDENENDDEETVALKKLTQDAIMKLIRTTNVTTQKAFIDELNDSKSSFFDQVSLDKIINSSLINCLSNMIHLLRCSEVIMSILDFLWSRIKPKDSQRFLDEFFYSSNGFYNLFPILKNQRDYKAELVLKVFDIMENIFSEKPSYYLESTPFWGLIYLLRDLEDEEQMKRILQLLSDIADMEKDRALDLKGELSYILTNKKQKTGEILMLDILSKLPDDSAEVINGETKCNGLEEEIEKIEMEEGMDNLKKICDFFEKMTNLDEQENNYKANQNANSSERDGAALLNDSSTTGNKKNETTFDFADMSVHSSDDEVFELFGNELFQMFLRGPSQYEPADSVATSWTQDNVYNCLNQKTPLIVWNQTKEEVIIKVMIKNVKEMNVIYGDEKIEFQTCVNECDYGFKLDLFAQVNTDEAKAETLSDYVLIKCKKKVQAIWCRLVKAVKKIHYIKSEYDNLKDASSDEEQMIFTGANGATGHEHKHLGKIRCESPESSNTSSLSNFDDELADDINLDKECRWD